MKANVSLAKGATSIVMVSPKNPDFAAIMLRSDVSTSNTAGFLQTEHRVGWLKGKTEEIQMLAKDLKEGDDFSAKCFPVKLVVKESNTPFYEGQEPKRNPKTNEIVTSLGATVYRQTLVVSESSSEADVKLTTDKAEAAVGAPSTKEAVNEFTK